MKSLKWMGCLFILLMMIGVLGCNDKDKTEPSGTVTPTQNTTPTATEPETKPASKPALEILNDKIETDKDTRYLVGTVKNNTGNKFKFVQFQIYFYDQFGTMIENTAATSHSLEPNGTWNFKILIKDKTVESYKFGDINRL